MKILISLTVALLLPMQGMQPAEACTVFVLDDGPRHYFGSNYDWHSGIGYVMVNPSGVAKNGWALPEDPGEPLRWQSKYGSLTFVQYGQGLPKGGMNSAGLVIEGLLLNDTQYPPSDENRYIGSSSMFKQYILDTCATVTEVVQSISRVRLAAYGWAPGVHFMVADTSGDCAVIEFLGGRPVVYHGDNLPAKVLTNHLYSKSIGPQDLNKYMEFSYAGSSRGRFKRAVERLQQYKPHATGEAVAYAMKTLDRVSAGSYTQWRVVYDQFAQVVYWRCGPEQALRWIDMKKIDFSCRNRTTALPVQQIIKGEANDHLALFTPKANRRLVYKAFGHSKDAIPLPEKLWEDVWRWPENNACMTE